MRMRLGVVETRAAAGMVAAFVSVPVTRLLFAAAAILALMPGVAWAQQDVARFEFSEVHMGTEFRVVLFVRDSITASEASTAAFATLARYDSLFSDYRTDSEVALLTEAADRGEAYRASAELNELLGVSRQWARRTGGAFDPTVGPLTRLWRWSARRGELPSKERREAAMALVGEDKVMGAGHSGALFMQKGMSLDFGGIAKGYAGDAMLRDMARHGVGAALVDAGGDVVAGDAPPGSDGWRVIGPGGVVLTIANQAVATSGDEYRYVEIGGVRYSHVVDPATGLGVVDAPTVTVLAPSGTTADVLASALTVMERREGDALVASVEGARRIELRGTHR